MKREDLIEKVDTWTRVAATIASYARGDNGKSFMTPEEMSSYLQVRWFLSHNRIKIQIEHNRESSNGDYWLGQYSIGNTDPYLLVFRRDQSLTGEEMETAENTIRVVFPYIKLLRCHFCEERIVSEKVEGEYFCGSCLDLIPTRQVNTFAYVYLFGSIEEGRFKIGQSKWPDTRLKNYEAAKLPFPVEMIHQIPADNGRRAESELHRLFREKRQNGEWFRLSSDDLKKVTSLRGYSDGHWIR